MVPSAIHTTRYAHRDGRAIGIARRVFCLLAVMLMLAASRHLLAADPAPASSQQTAAAQTPLEQRPLVRQGSARNASSAPVSTGAETGLGLWRVLLSLAAVVGLILLMRWGGLKWFKGQGGPQTPGAMQVVARSVIAPRQQLLLVRVGRRLMVLGNGSNGLTALGQITDPDEVAEVLGQLKRGGELTGGPFASIFNRAASDYPALQELPHDPPMREVAADKDEAAVPSTDAMQSELKGLLEKVRGMARQFRKEV